MIEKTFVEKGINHAKLEEYLNTELGRANYSRADITKTPVSTKITIYAEKPGLVIGRGGSRIKELIEVFKNRFDIENPQVEVNEVEQPDLDARVVAKNMASWLEKGGHPKRVGNTYLHRILEAGALGAQIEISGKLSGSRGRGEKFIGGYIKKCGDVARRYVDHAYEKAVLPPGAIGVKVMIMQDMPDYMKLLKGGEASSARRTIEIDLHALLDKSIDEIKETVNEFNLDVEELLELETAGENRKTLVNYLESQKPAVLEEPEDTEETEEVAEEAVEEEESEDTEEAEDTAEELEEEESSGESPTPEDIVSGTISDAKDALENFTGDLEAVLEAEKSGKNRVTLIEYLENRVEEGEE